MSLMMPIKELKAPIRESRPSLSSVVFQPPAVVERVSLEDILSNMGRIGLATKAQRYCHLDAAHEAWCRYIADVLRGISASIPSTPPPPEIRELIKEITQSIPSAQGLKKLLAGRKREEETEREKRRKIEVVAKQLGQLLSRAFAGDRRALHKLREAVSALRDMGGDEAEVLTKQLEAEMERRKIPGQYAEALAKSIRRIAEGEASENELMNELERLMNERRKKPGATTHVTAPRQKTQQESQNEMASLAMLRLAGFPTQNK